MEPRSVTFKMNNETNDYDNVSDRDMVECTLIKRRHPYLEYADEELLS
ncbi:hypothetical protein ES702_00400 [subsurface metagenome]